MLGTNHQINQHPPVPPFPTLSLQSHKDANETHLTDGIQTTRARAATLHLPHGPVQLPIFMPVATQASLKGLTPRQLEETGCRLCLNNTYHLYVFLNFFLGIEMVMGESGGGRCKIDADLDLSLGE